MPNTTYSLSDFKELNINNFTGGMRTNPLRPSDHFMIYNMYVRDDGYLVPRGTVFELQLPTAFQPNSTFPIDSLVNNTGGPMSGGGETPYLFFLQNYPTAGKLGFLKVNHTGASQTISSVDNTLNTSLSSPSVPTTAWGISSSGAPIFLFSVWNGSGDDVQYQWSGSGLLTRITASPPGAQTLIGFYDRSAFAGGGSVTSGYSIPLRNLIYWSNPLDPTTWPATSFTAPFSEKGLALQDMVIVNSRPLITTNVSFLSITGTTDSTFVPIEIGRVEDLLLKNTLATNGTIPIVAALNGVYVVSSQINDISLPVKGIYNPTTFGFGINNINLKVGYASLSSNGYFYGVYNKIPASGTLISNLPLVHTTNEKSVFMIYDTRFKIWYYWGYEFTPQGIVPMDPNALNVTTSANTFLTGFAFTGVSPAGKNSLYFSESSNTTGSDTVDGVSVNYKTGFTSGPIDFGIPEGLKQIGGVYIVGTTSNSIELIVEASVGDGWERVGQYEVDRLNEFISLDIKGEKIRVTLNGDSTMVLGEIKLYYKVIDSVLCEV